MKLRKWQNECVQQVLRKYEINKRHFLCLATPGSGKTTMAAEVTARLFDKDLIDFVFCFSPAITIKNDIRSTLEARMSCRFDGVIGARGDSYTYQSMPSLDDKIWHLLRTHRVLVIFDEIHHCSGLSPESANAWGERIITKIQDQATYTLALTGTPWRSDKAPVVLAEYKGSDNKVVCDYIYGLADAIQDKVCRTPQIIVTDNNDVSLQKQDGVVESFNSFSSLLEETSCPYQKIVENVEVIRHILKQASIKLSQIRLINPSAGGLVVAASVAHAKTILNILIHELNESAVIATYQENEATGIIEAFKQSSTPWIVSVGMISEGTNIPRLQVCCHLTRIKTELHFRQILGRILRVTSASNQEACLYMPAEKTLIEYAQRVAEDIPEEASVVRFDNSGEAIFINEFEEAVSGDSNTEHDLDHEIIVGKSLGFKNDETSPTDKDICPLTENYETTLNVFGQFHQDILALNVMSIE